MADTKISQLADGFTAEPGDRIPVARVGSNAYITPGYLLQYVEDALADDFAAASAPPYTHTQSSASDTWVINHNMGMMPSIELRTVGGVVFDGAVTHTSDNQAIANFATPIAGTARCK